MLKEPFSDDNHTRRFAIRRVERLIRALITIPCWLAFLAVLVEAMFALAGQVPGGKERLEQHILWITLFPSLLGSFFLMTFSSWRRLQTWTLGRATRLVDARNRARVERLQAAGVTVIHPETVWVSDGATVAPGAHITGPALISSRVELSAQTRLGRGTFLEEGAVLSGACTVGDDVYIGSSASIANCTIGDEVRVITDEALENCVIGSNARILTAARLSGQTVAPGQVIRDGSMPVRIIPDQPASPPEVEVEGVAADVSPDPARRKA